MGIYVWKPGVNQKDAIEALDRLSEKSMPDPSEHDDYHRDIAIVRQALADRAKEKDGAYWERNMIALLLSNIINYHTPHYGICGWYPHQGEGFEGWSRVLSLDNGKITFHVPDDFDLGDLPQIEPNWDGHTTEEKWKYVMHLCGCKDAEPT
ncbi:hypothetical protein [Brevibacillus migulae]|uniref:hypothetical protein n=1 Tax=Brevibacillus migulae TaxID=1644114 RepID=UPI00106E7BD9|nr:hypothetical protein [Brevibacillus migulae]